MEKTIEKGNLIDLFGCLIPGMLMILMTWFMIPETRVFETDGSIIAGLSILLVFVLTGYLAGLVLMECAVILQTLCPKKFDYFANAQKCLYQKEEGSCRIFRDATDRKKINLLTGEKKCSRAYNYMEFWLITNGYNEYVERKKAYFLMNRSIVVIPLLFLFINPVLYFCVLRYRLGNQALTVCQWLWSGRTFLGCTWWKWFVLSGFFALFFHRAERQARLSVWEISMTYMKAVKSRTVSKQDRIMVEVGGYKIGIPDDYNEQTLSKILKMICKT